jgi:alpha-1,3-rhamnosyl/mannosyltransferase
VVITIHDLSWIRYPAAHPIDRVRWLDKGLPKALDRARAVLVDSEFIRREVLTTFGIDAETVHVAHLGVPRRFAPAPPEETVRSLPGLGLQHGKYILTVGTIEPRKNLGHMLEAHALLPESVKAEFPLVIAGAKGWRSHSMLTRLRNQDDRHVCFLGHVSSEQLAHLYAGAALFAFPSIYEGFGLPPLEAMACGAPVIVSNRSSLPEIVGDAGEMMNPEDPEDTARRMHALLDDPSRRQRMAEQGLRRAAKFTWSHCAAVTRSVYLAALGLDDARQRPTFAESRADVRETAATPPSAL